MLKDILDIAEKLLEVAEGGDADVIDVFKDNIIKGNNNTARILSDELVDFYKETNAGSFKIRNSEEMYNKTMEYYELNY